MEITSNKFYQKCYKSQSHVPTECEPPKFLDFSSWLNVYN